jgi:2-succinyl-6-hydroxy-2,4-cyclohexadiene-1-carboxylate synthase
VAVGAVGRPTTTPLVLVHGFTQTGLSWSPVIDALGEGIPVVVPDAPGHGGSTAVRADLWQTANLLAASVAVPAHWAGYSMGGRMALHVALAHPDKVQRLVLISVNPGIEDASQREARRSSDDALAARIERDGVERFLAYWLAQPLFATLGTEGAGLEARLANTAAGLASSLRLTGTGSQDPLWERLGELRDRAVPVLVMAGALDRAYSAHAERIAALIGPGAELLVVEGAGHACHLERPYEVATAIRRFCGLPANPSSDQGATANLRSEGAPRQPGR